MVGHLLQQLPFPWGEGVVSNGGADLFIDGVYLIHLVVDIEEEEEGVVHIGLRCEIFP